MQQHKYRRSAVAAVLLLGSGCITPANTRLPMFLPRSLPSEVNEAKIQDPFPDKDLGPDMDIRPRDYQYQRPEAQHTKDRYYSGLLRQRFGATPSVAPATPVSPGAYYPGYYPSTVE